MKNAALIVSLGTVMGLVGLCVFGISQPEEEDPRVEQIRSVISQLEVVPVEEKAKILVCSRTAGFRHSSIPVGIEAFTQLGEITQTFEPVFTEDLDLFEAEELAQFDAVVFLNTTGELFLPYNSEWNTMSEEEREQAKAREARLKENLQNFVEQGGGFIGIHAATDTFYNWPWYGEMIGGYFDGHPWSAFQKVTIKIDPEAVGNPLLANLPEEPFEITEEIYQFKNWTAGHQKVLTRLDIEKTDMNKGGIRRTDGDFPLTWYRMQGQGRVFYGEYGHNDHIYWHSGIMSHYFAAIQWVLGQREAPELLD